MRVQWRQPLRIFLDNAISFFSLWTLHPVDFPWDTDVHSPDILTVHMRLASTAWLEQTPEKHDVFEKQWLSEDGAELY